MSVTARSLAGQRTSRLPLVILVSYLAAGALIAPFAGRPGPVITGITPFFVGTLMIANLVTGFLLLVRFADLRRLSLLVLGCAYVYSGLMPICHFLTFPEALVPGGPYIGTSESTAWIFTFWIFGFSLLALIAMSLETVPRAHVLDGAQVQHAIWLGLATVLVAIVFLFVLATGATSSLPPLMIGPNWSTLNIVASLVVLATICCAIVIGVFRVSSRNEVFLWLTLALGALAVTNLLSLLSGGRYSVGWSLGRLSWIISSCLLLVYFMMQFREQQRLLAEERDQLESHVAARTAALEATNARLTLALSERGLLIKEVYHRVKNNLQLISSVISLQTARLQDPDARAAFHDLHRRVYSVGLVHDQLMQSKDLVSLNLQELLRNLCRHLEASSGADQRSIAITLERADSVVAKPDYAIPIGLLVTELISNAIKHAFAPGESGRVTVSLHAAPDRLELIVSDNGGGEMPQAAAAQPNLGLQIVNALVGQLQGTLTTAREGGTRVSVILPAPQPTLA